jgi:hypothetical protein
MDLQEMTNRMHAGMRRSLTLFGGKLALLFIGLGTLAVGLATNGASGIPIVAAQMPYLLSGLGIGLGLIIFGSGLMVVQSAREDRARLERKLDDLLAAMQAGLAHPNGSAPADLKGLVLAGSASYHTPGCTLVEGRDEARYLTPGEARSRNLQPCRVCQPDAVGTEPRTQVLPPVR